MPRGSPKPRAQSQGGSSLLELLVVVLILGLITAAFIAKSPDFAKPDSQLPEGSGSPVLQQALSRWLTDPSESQPNEPQANEPQANEPQANEPQANEPQANEPQANEPQPSSAEVPFDAEVDGPAYETTLQELEAAGLLERWAQLLESRLPEQHPVLTALGPQDEPSMQKLEPSDSAEPLVQRTPPEVEATESSEMVWSDGQPVSVTPPKP